jgi:heme-degrading monooxygenase HmoA
VDTGAHVIVESALITLRSGSESQFEAVFPAAAKILAASPGYLSHSLHRSIETPNRYLLTVHWRTLEDHTVGFRGSPLFAKWRAHIGPFFEIPPVVEHFAAV